MDACALDTVRTYAEVVTAIGTLALAIATFILAFLTYQGQREMRMWIKLFFGEDPEKLRERQTMVKKGEFM